MRARDQKQNTHRINAPSLYLSISSSLLMAVVCCVAISSASLTFRMFCDFDCAESAMSVALGLGGSQEIHDIARSFEIDRSVNNKCIPHLIDVVRQRRSYVDVYYCYYLLLHIARDCVCVSSLRRLCAVCCAVCVCTRFFRYSFLMSERSSEQAVRCYQRIRLTCVCKFPFQLLFVIIYYIRINITYTRSSLARSLASPPLPAVVFNCVWVSMHIHPFAST